MDRHGNYNNERLLVDFGSSILNPLMCTQVVPSVLLNMENEFLFTISDQMGVIREYASKPPVISLFYKITSLGQWYTGSFK